MPATRVPDRIILSAVHDTPHQTAAQWVALQLDLQVEQAQQPQEGALNIGAPAFARRWTGAAQAIEEASSETTWELMAPMPASGWFDELESRCPRQLQRRQIAGHRGS